MPTPKGATNFPVMITFAQIRSEPQPIPDPAVKLEETSSAVQKTTSRSLEEKPKKPALSPRASPQRSNDVRSTNAAKLQRRGLEPSAGMLELFGSGPSSCFTHIPAHPNMDGVSFGRRNVLEREFTRKSGQPPPIPYDPTTSSHFTIVPDHDKRAESARMRASWRADSQMSASAHFDRIPIHSDNEDERRRTRVRSDQRPLAADPTEMTGDRRPPSTTAKGGVGNGRIPTGDGEQAKQAPGRQGAQSTGRDTTAFVSSGGGGFGGGGGGGGSSTASSAMETPIKPKTTTGVAAEPWQDKSSGGSLFIKGGQIVNDDSMFTSDIIIEDGTIKQVGPNLQPPTGARVLDAAGKMVLPGGIDSHTHFQLPFAGVTSVDDFLTGSKAALTGGTTTIIDTVFPNAGESLLTAYDRWRSWADNKIACNYGLSVVVGVWSDRAKDEMVQLTKEKGVNSFVFHMANKAQGYMLRDDALFQAFSHCKHIGALARVHAENGDVVQELQQQMLSLGITGPEGHLQARPEDLEAEATNRACVLGKASNCPLYVLHVMSKGSAQAIAKHRKKGTIVFGEATTAGLGTDGTHYFNKCWRHAAGHVTAPPLRPDPTTPGALMDMLSSGELYLAASNHRTFSSDQRAAGGNDFTKIPNGTNGVEERMAVVWEKGVHNGKMDPMRFVAVTSSNPAKLFNLYPRKGRIAAGADADIVVWDPSAKQKFSSKTHMSATDLNIFEGMTCHGLPIITVCGGRVAFEDGKVLAAAGAGKFVTLPANSPHLFSVIHQRERVCLPEKVQRTDAPAGAVASKQVSQQNAAIHGRPPTSTGGRNQFDSSAFNASGAQIDDGRGARASTKISQPPGGKTSGLW